MSDKRSVSVETTTLNKVSDENKKDWISMAFIWAGNVICVPALMVGGMVVTGLDFKNAVIAMIIGYAIVVGYMMFLAGQSAQLGVPATVAFSRAFGKRGAGLIISAIIAVSLTGWFGFQTYVCANSFSMILASYLGVEFPLWLASLLWGGAMLFTAVYGIGLIKFLNMISVPALFAFLIYGVFVLLKEPANYGVIGNYVPPNPSSLLTGVIIAVGGFATGAIISGDYTRYCKTGKDAMISCVVGVIPAGVGALVCGAIMSICSGSYDITVMFADIGMPIAGLIVLILATWTTNTGNAYSSGIALVNIFKLKDDKRMHATIVSGLIGIALSLGGIINGFVPFLSLLGYLIPPVAGVAIADYWILGKGDANSWKSMEGLNWIGIISWIIGCGIGYFFPTVLIPTINGIVVSAVCYIILIKLVKNPKYNPFM